MREFANCIELCNKAGIYYKVIDEYTLFYLKWIKPIKDGLTYDTGAAGYWMRQQNSPTWHSWAGISFESVCHKHINQIRSALGLDVTAIPSTWYFNGKKTGQNGAQIDLLFDRIDNTITLCEIKFTNQPFSIDKVYAANIENKVQVFKNATRTKKQIFFSMISANGLQRSKYSDELVTQIVTLEDLFEDNK